MEAAQILACSDLTDQKDRVLFMAYGLSPSDISFFDYDRTTRHVIEAGDSPYHGDHALGELFFLKAIHRRSMD